MAGSNALFDSFVQYVTAAILEPIAQHMTSKGIPTTSPELASLLQLPRANVASHMAFGGAVPSMVPSAASSSSRKNTVVTAPVQGQTCGYQYKRGGNKGQFCGKATAPGEEFCSSCIKSRKNLSKDLAAGAAAPTAGGSKSGGIPGMAGIPSGAPTAPSDSGSLNVVPYDVTRNLYKEPNHGFIVSPLPDGRIAVLGRLSETENKVVSLTPDEQQVAVSIGLSVVESEQTIASVSIHANPPAPVVGSKNTLPSIPSIASPTSANVPQIPGN